MLVKLFKGLVVTVLVLLPYSTILSLLSPYLTNHSFSDYLIGSAAFAIVTGALVLFVANRETQKTVLYPAFVLATLGPLVAPPLMLGPPVFSPELSKFATEEHFRYALLVIAALVFALGMGLLLKAIWTKLSNPNRLVSVLIAFASSILLWDAGSSYLFSYDFDSWISAGKNSTVFFETFDMHEFLRTAGRSLIYLIVPWISFLLARIGLVKRWVVIVLAIFSLLGIVFFFLFNFVDFQFYFPFMIPAIALAPAYWLGLALLTGKNTNQSGNLHT